MASPIQPLAKPVYPPAALGRQTSPVMIGVRITVDEHGRVAHVAMSPLGFSTPSPFAGQFHAAVEEALAQWRFRPAILRHLVPKKEAGGRYHWVVMRAEQTECVFDVSFTFSASGDVTSAPPK